MLALGDAVVMFVPCLQMLLGGQPVGFLGVAGPVRQDQVVDEIDCVRTCL